MSYLRAYLGPPRFIAVGALVSLAGACDEAPPADAVGRVVIATDAHATGLPALHIVSPTAIGDEYAPVELSYRGHIYRAKAKLRGSSSRVFPKKSYTLKFRDDDPFADPERPGFSGKRRLVLLGSFDDSSQLRARLAFEVWNRLQGGALRIDSHHVALYLDGGYRGLYLLADHLDEDFFAARGLGGDGQLFEGITHDANFASLDLVESAYEKKAGLPAAGSPGAYDEIARLTGLVTSTESADFDLGIARVIDLRSYGSWLILASAIQAGDSFGKNTYHYRPPAGAPWRVVPWDFNHSFGQDWATLREAPTVALEDQAAGNLLLARLLRHDRLGPRLRARYARALHRELAIDGLLERIDAWTAEIAAEVGRDEQLWHERQAGFERWAERGGFTDFAAEVPYLKSWVRARWAFLDQALGAPAEPRQGPATVIAQPAQVLAASRN